MLTQHSPTEMEFGSAGGRRVVADFDGGLVSSDAGALLLGETDKAIGLIDRFAACFVDHRSPLFTVHPLKALIGQRLFGLALGYEDLNDHDDLRRDPVLGVLLGKLERGGDEPSPLAGKSTLNRLEHAPGARKKRRYHKIVHDGAAIERLFVDLFLDAHSKPPRQIVLDLDATDDPLHGEQEGRFFHGYYRCYCYMPLYVFCGRDLLAAKLRPSNIDGSAGAQEEMTRIVAQIRARWPRVKIVLRADSGFARESLMAWCEANGVDYVFGLARNERLQARIADALSEAELLSRANAGQPARVFRDFDWSTKDSWSRRRRVIGKAEWTQGEANPRFLVTSLNADAWRAQPLYEELYCARGEMENRIKECQGDLFADRTSTATMRANQLRLWFASIAYALVCAMRRIGLAHTGLASATCGTIRLKLLKLGALIKISARRVRIAFASACPNAEEWRLAAARLANARPPPA
jgi:Transposase DDE domain group 1